MKFENIYFEKSNERLTLQQESDILREEQESYYLNEKNMEEWYNYKLYQKNDVHLFSKYYVVNKKKRDNSNIQENVRQKVRELNRIHRNNKYFFGISQDLINNNENKHKYNNFDISVIEFECIRVSDIFNNNWKLSKTNLPNRIKREIMVNTVNFIRSNKNEFEETDRNNKNFTHHSELLKQTYDFLNCSIFNIFNNPFGIRLNQIVQNTSYRCCDYASPQDIIEEIKDEKLIEEMADLYISLELNFNTKWINFKNNSE